MIPMPKRCIRCDRPFRVFNERLTGLIELCTGCRMRAALRTPSM
jgi:hypothetical protein